MKFKYFFIAGLFLFVTQAVFPQDIDEQLGAAFDSRYRTGLYDFSDPGAINIKVSVWGYVSRPGKYIVPDYTSVSDLLSFAGGPNRDSELDDLRIYRTLENGKEQLIKFSYDDLMWDDELETRNRVLPTLKASDILIIPGSPRLFFTDWFRLSLQIFSAVLSIINIIILINRY